MNNMIKFLLIVVLVLIIFRIVMDFMAFVILVNYLKELIKTLPVY